MSDDEADDAPDDLAELIDSLDDDTPEPMCRRIVLRRLVDAVTATIDTADSEPADELATALDVARAELEWCDG